MGLETRGSLIWPEGKFSIEVANMSFLKEEIVGMPSESLDEGRF